MSDQREAADRAMAMKRDCVRTRLALVLILCAALLSGCLYGCGNDGDSASDSAAAAPANEKIDGSEAADAEERAESEDAEEDRSSAETDDSQTATVSSAKSDGSLSLKSIPAYSGQPYVEVDGNEPSFANKQLKANSYEKYAELDSLGRCGSAIACLSVDTMPTEERGDIGMIKPSGWQISKYSFVDGKYLYNRCHLIGYQLSGENANERNLITGTRYLNVEGMLPFEDEVADYIERTGNHVLYRVTPIFKGDDLVARGVHMEAESIEDNGEGIGFNVFVYNVQPGVEIDYSDGDNKKDGTVSGKKLASYASSSGSSSQSASTAKSKKTTATYILNANSGKFHYASCRSVADMSESNKVYFNGTRKQAIAKGYEPCKICNP